MSCCSELDLINVAKLSAGRQQLSPIAGMASLVFVATAVDVFALTDRTLMLGCAMSALGHKRTCAVQ